MQHPSPPSIDLTAAAAASGIVATLFTVLRFVPPIRGWLRRRERERVRRVVAEAFADELRRSEQTAAELLAVHDRLDAVEDTMAHNAELLEHIPALLAGQARIERDVGELRTDIKSVLQQLGQVQGQNTRRPV